MEDELKNLRIDRAKKNNGGSRWAVRWILAGVILIALLGAANLIYGWMNRAAEVEVVRVQAASAASAAAGGETVILNATGYIIAAHKIQVASKVLGRVAWIGVEKGDKVKEGQVIVRLEDDEYKAQLTQARGQFESLEARLQEMVNGSRPEEIAKAKADLDQARADVTNAKVTLDRTKGLVEQGVLSKQSLDDAQARYDSAVARERSMERTYELVRIGPRKEQIDAVRGQIVQARGAVDFFETQLANTVIRAPVTGTILERAVEKGEFVTTSFVGERGAKGYVVSLADLNDLRAELDINQNDFAKLGPKQRGIISVDAFPDRKYEGVIDQISPEANRQKATVQVKVRVLKPDEYLRPEMNASVAFLADERPSSRAVAAKPVVTVPNTAVKDGAVFVLLNGRAVRRAVKIAGSTSQGLRVEEGLIGGEDLIVSPPAGLKDGDKAKKRGA
jgi:HlyD family secretion protein